MPPILVTGANGFAGSHLLDQLRGGDGPLVAWSGPGREPRPEHLAGDIGWTAVDLRDGHAVEAALADAHPSHIFHLGGVARVAESWQQTTLTLEVNVLGTHHLLRAIRRLGLKARIVVPGSALVYGPSADALTEDHPVRPVTPYGLTKLAQELVGLGGHADGLAVIAARPFNHIGPRQDEGFAVSSFARQIARAEAGLDEPMIKVGNLDARRDVTDVRDVVRAYRLLADRGTPGRVYNICSEAAPAIRDLLDRLVALAHVPVGIHVDPARMRPSDNPVVLGSAKRIREELGWRPSVGLDRSLEDTLNDWRSAVRGDAVPRARA
jgi:GDP-4-dehydro-6-deoxy-D-mannose reductase